MAGFSRDDFNEIISSLNLQDSRPQYKLYAAEIIAALEVAWEKVEYNFTETKQPFLLSSEKIDNQEKPPPASTFVDSTTSPSLSSKDLLTPVPPIQENLSVSEVTKKLIERHWQIYTYYNACDDKQNCKVYREKIIELLLSTYSEVEKQKFQKKIIFAKKYGEILPFTQSVWQLLDRTLRQLNFKIPGPYPSYEDNLINQTLIKLLNEIKEAIEKKDSQKELAANRVYHAFIEKKHFNDISSEDYSQFKSIIVHFDDRQQKNIKIISLRQLLFFSQQAKNKAKIREIESELLLELEIETQDLSYYEIIFNNTQQSIDKRLKHLRIEIPDYAYDENMDRVSKTILEILRLRNTANETTDQRNLLTHYINQVVEKLKNKQNLDEINILEDSIDELKRTQLSVMNGIVERFKQSEKYDQLLSVTVNVLWQHLCIGNNELVKTIIKDHLFNLLEIPEKKRKWAAWSKWLPWIESEKALIYKSMVKNEIIIPSFNDKIEYIKELKRSLVSVYRVRLKKLEDLMNKEQENHGPITQLQKQCEIIRNFLLELNINKDLSSFSTDETDDQEIKKIVDSFNQFVSNNARGCYLKAYSTFKKVLEAPLLSKVNLFNSYKFDKDFYTVLMFLKSLSKDGHTQLEEIFKEYFNSVNEVNDPNAALERFAKYVLQRFSAVDSADFHNFNINPLQLAITKKHYKKAINRWLERYDLPYALSIIPEHRRLYATCNDLILQLKKASNLPARLHSKSQEVQAFFATCIYPPSISDVARLKLIKKQAVYILRKSLIPYTEKVVMYEFVKRYAIKNKKVAKRQQKKRTFSVALIATVVLSIGQAFLGLYALLQLSVIFPGVLIFVLAGVCAAGTIYANYSLFKQSTYQILNQFFVNKDWFNGFTSKEGKGLMLIVIVLAFFASLTMTGLVTLSMLSALGTGGIGLPIAILAPILASVAITTLIGFTALLYKALAVLINKVCDKLVTLFPEIVKEGWGFQGLCKGIWQGLLRIHHTIIKPGKYHSKGGLLGYLGFAKHKVNHLVTYLKNPTGNKDASEDEIIYKRIEISVKFILKPIWMGICLGLVAFATVATLNAWHDELVEFFMHNSVFDLTATAATWLSYGVVYAMTGIVQAVFNTECMVSLFNRLSNKVSEKFIAPLLHGIYKFGVSCLESVGLKKRNPLATDSSIQHASPKKPPIFQRMKNAFTHFYKNPEKTVLRVFRRCKEVAIDKASAIWDGFNEATLVLKDLLLLNGQANPHSIGTLETLEIAATGISVESMADDEFAEQHKMTVLDYIPLDEYEAKKKNLSTSAQVANGNSGESPSTSPNSSQWKKESSNEDTLPASQLIAQSGGSPVFTRLLEPRHRQQSTLTHQLPGVLPSTAAPEPNSVLHVK